MGSRWVSGLFAFIECMDKGQSYFQSGCMLLRTFWIYADVSGYDFEILSSAKKERTINDTSIFYF